MEPHDSTPSHIRFMLHRPIGLPAAAALRRRGVDGIPPDAALHLIDVPDDESVESGAWEAWLDSGGDEDDTEDGGAGAAGVTFTIPCFGGCG